MSTPSTALAHFLEQAEPKQHADVMTDALPRHVHIPGGFGGRLWLAEAFQQPATNRMQGRRRLFRLVEQSVLALHTRQST